MKIAHRLIAGLFAVACPLGSALANCAYIGALCYEDRTNDAVIPTGQTSPVRLGDIAAASGINPFLSKSLAFSGANAISNHLLSLSASVTGSSTDPIAGVYTFSVGTDQTAVPNGGYIDHIQMFCTMGGGGFSGTRDCVHSLVGFNATPSAGAMAADISSRNIVSNLAEGYANQPWGGTPGFGNARGELTGYNANVRLTPAAQYWNILTAQENDISAQGVAGLFRKYGLLIVEGSDDTTQGSQEDAAINLSNGPGSIGWGVGLQFGQKVNSTNGFPINVNGSLISVVNPNGGSSTLNKALYGVDLRNLVVQAGGAAFASNGFSVDPSGGVTGTTTVQAKGSPAGIVTVQANNTAVGAAVQAGFSATTGTANSSLQETVLDSNGAPITLWSVGTAIVNSLWRAPAYFFQSQDGSQTWLTLNSATATFGKPVTLAPYTVAALPACGGGLAGAIAYVTDLTTPTYNGTLTGGGAVKRTVTCNGTAWVS